jgi:hypothetical protein
MFVMSAISLAFLPCGDYSLTAPAAPSLKPVHPEWFPAKVPSHPIVPSSLFLSFVGQNF